MITDGRVALIPPNAPLSLVGGAGVNFQSQVLDLLDAGVGVAPPGIIGTASVFGTDFGIGDEKPLLEFLIGTGLVTANGATLNVQFQAAPDTGSAGGYQPGAWQTIMETGAMTAAQLIAGTVFGRFDWPPDFPANLQPRFVRINFSIPTGTNFTAGTVAYGLITMGRSDQSNKFAARNFNV